MFSVEKTKDNETFIEVLPFNPVVEGWDFIEACCCSVEFRKGNTILSVAKQKGYMCFTNGDNRTITALPHNQVGFMIRAANYG